MPKPSFLEVKNIVDTLPIGFYCGRKIETSLQEKEQTSYYNLMQDTIVISYEQIVSGMDNLNDSELEMEIRSNYYHEIAHAILTPKDIKVKEHYNIFEDERIETLLNNYFYNVDFKKSIIAECGFDINNPPPPKNPMQAFFYTVRFRCGKPQFLSRVNNIIKKYASLNRNTSYYYRYLNEVDDLYNDIEKDFKQNPPPPSQLQSQNQQDGFSQDLQVDPNQGQGQECENCPMVDLPQDLKDFLTKNAQSIKNTIKNSIKEVFNGKTTFNQEFHQAASIIFDNFNRKNAKGSALQGYSGVINPRLADRKDYKFFERSTSARGNNQFGSFHLNLFIDNSGSFSYNKNITNSILKSLALLEKKNPNFTFDMVLMNKGETLCEKEKRFIPYCNNGNALSRDIEKFYKQLQLPQTYNYNIILFDGDAYSHPMGVREKKRYLNKGEGFRTFAHNNCSIITDRDNKSYIEQYCPNTRTIYTNDYVNELTNNILTILQIALK